MWENNAKKFPNLEVRARQHTLAARQRQRASSVFSIVGIAFSDKRKNSTAATLADICFTKVNLYSQVATAADEQSERWQSTGRPTGVCERRRQCRTGDAWAREGREGGATGNENHRTQQSIIIYQTVSETHHALSDLFVDGCCHCESSGV